MTTLTNDERISFALRELYESYGYRQYKMSKFEEYDFYIRNKESLISEGVVTFTDTDGKLMALKPDVTLSIIKQIRDDENTFQKVYYNENVYRVSPTAHCFKEIGQMGLECIGNIDTACMYEVISLAAASLRSIDAAAVLDISHLGMLHKLLDGLDAPTRADFCRLLGQKNAHELETLGRSVGLSDQRCHTLCALTTLYGTPDTVLPRLRELLGEDDPALAELSYLCKLLKDETVLRIDPSMTDDMNYYGSFVFKGFVKGVPENILSGGRYDPLLHRMGKAQGAVGFALYLDRLERLGAQEAAPDADILLMYDENCDIAALYAAAARLRKEGSVVLQKTLPEGRFGKICRFQNGEVQQL